MMSVFLGQPGAKIKQWIVEHSKKPAIAETKIYYTEASGKAPGMKLIEGELTWESIGKTTIYAAETTIEKVELGTAVTSIGNNAFYNCRSLTSVQIPDSVTSIGNQTFSYCSSLTSVQIPDSVTSIGYGAFFGCTSLTSVDLTQFDETSIVPTLSSGVFSSNAASRKFYFKDQATLDKFAATSNWSSYASDFEVKIAD